MYKKVLLLILASKILSKNKLRVDTKLKTIYFDTPENRFNAIQLYTGTGEEENTEKINLEINLGYNKIIIGNKNYLNWGIFCNELYINSCQVKNGSVLNDFYYYKNYYYQNAESYFKFLEEDVLEVREGIKMKFDLIYLSDLWPIEEIGVVGFGPKSDFGRYLRDLYEEEIYFLIEFNSGEILKKYKNYQLNFILNPAFEKKDVKLELVFENKDFYDIPANLEFLNKDKTEVIFKESTLCFTTVEDILLFLPDRAFYCKKLLSEICENPNNCNKENSNFNKSIDILIKIQNEDFIFGYQDYLYIQENGEIRCSFGGLDIEGFQICPENTIFGIGKNFINKFPLILGYKKDLTTDFIILKKKVLNEPDYIFWIVLSSLAAIFSLIVIIYVCCYKEDDEDNYDLYIPVGMS